MTITKNLTRTLFITALIMLTMTNSRQLHTMNRTSLCELRRTGPEAINANDETLLDADFQIYKLLSLIDKEHQCCLLPELVQIIANDVSKLIDKECYEKHGSCLINSTALLRFIEIRLPDKFMSHTYIANIIKRCLRHDEKSLSDIVSYHKGTVFHDALSIGDLSRTTRMEWIQILKLVAENEAWNMICTKDNSDRTSLYFAILLRFSTNEILSAAPNPQESWNLILTAGSNGHTTLKTAQLFQHPDLELLESYRPKEQ